MPLAFIGCTHYQNLTELKTKIKPNELETTVVEAKFTKVKRNILTNAPRCFSTIYNVSGDCRVHTNTSTKLELTCSRKMNDSYLMWQNQSLLEIKAKRAANQKAIAQAIGGAALIGLGVLAAVAGVSSHSVAAQTAGTAGLLVGGIAGASLVAQSFRSSEEANVHRDTQNELGQSVDLEMGPKVIAFNKDSVELTGNAREQFIQWRTFLQKIYSERHRALHIGS